MTTIVGISAYYHDSAIAVIRDGAVVCAAQEERFSRIKNDASFPAKALQWARSAAGIRTLADIDYIVFYEKPFIKFERLIETHLKTAPRGLAQFVRAMPGWLTQKLMARRTLERAIRGVFSDQATPLPPLLFNDHHGSHAAAAFFASPFETAAVLCLDGVGEWDSSTAWSGHGNKLTPLWRIPFPHSLGLLYSAFTGFCGFRVNSGEYKLMGLAPYGEPTYVDLIESKLIDIRPDGSFHMDMAYFDYQTGLRMTNRKFAQLFGGPAHEPDTPPTQREMDMAASIQAVTEKIALRAAQHLQQQTKEKNLCLGGGVALNCVANGALQRAGIFENIWIPPSPGDAGSAIGCALSAWHEHLDKPRHKTSVQPRESSNYLGPEWKDEEIPEILHRLGANFEVADETSLMTSTANLLAQGKVVGWFQGGMEFGPRALGARSILGDPRDAGMVQRMNLKIKHRESFRPFAPSVLAEHVQDWFDFPAASSPFMHTVAPVALPHRIHAAQTETGLARINEKRSTIPAVTHINMSARLHTVSPDSSPRFHALISRFHDMTGVPLLINTSFNVRGEPIVATPEDAWRCFMGTDMDALVIGNCILHKELQAQEKQNPDHVTVFSKD